MKGNWSNTAVETLLKTGNHDRTDGLIRICSTNNRMHSSFDAAFFSPLF